MIYSYHLALVFALLLNSSYEGINVFITNVVIGWLIAYTVLRFLPEVPGDPEKRLFVPRANRVGPFIRNLGRFFYDFVKDLILSNVVVAMDVWRPKGRYKPVMVEIPVDDLNDFETALLASRITLTPGTLSSAVSADKKTLLVHAMYDGGPTQAAGLRKPIDILKEGL
jgi:multicomponent K+:H+ antiporter subunit E